MTKSVKAAKAATPVVAPITGAQRKLINQAAELGYNHAGGFEASVAQLKRFNLATDGLAIDAFSRQFKAGYIVRYRESDRAYAKRSSNQPLSIKAECALEIMDKPQWSKKKDEAGKPQTKGARTEEEQRMVKAAEQSLSLAKGRAGLTVIAPRKAKTPVAPVADVPVDLTKSIPTFKSKEAANDFFPNMAAALLQACDRSNAATKGKAVIPALTTAVSDFQTAVKAALGLK